MKKRFLAILLVMLLFLMSCSKSTQFILQPTMNQTDYAALDYSSHTESDEMDYTTVLADTSLLKEGKRVIAQKEPPADWSWISFEGFDHADDVFGYDVRSCDISGVDLSVVEDINRITFDTETTWPKVLPEDFDPKKLLEYNKNPGLGIRALHKKGVTGKGVGIAIIDQGLLLDHEQYKDNLMLYERIHCLDESATMHGPGVSSIAAGKDIGVAPKARLYYIASTFGHFSDNGYNFDASIIADTILRVLEINKKLSEEDKIRVISISKGYNRLNKGYEELQEAIRKADEDNVFVLTTSTEEYYKNFKLFGMDRDYNQNPEELSSYKPVSWIEENYYEHPEYFEDYLMFPIGSRTFAGSSKADSYALSRNGGLSWAVPWCAGLYALCCQIKPEITPQEFIEAAYSTALTQNLEHDGKTYSFGKMINPEGIIEKIKKQ